MDSAPWAEKGREPGAGYPEDRGKKWLLEGMCDHHRSDAAEGGGRQERYRRGLGAEVTSLNKIQDDGESGGRAKDGA